MAEAAMIFFLRRLAELVVDEADHLSRVHEQVGWIQKELQAMVAFLKDADRRQQRDERVATWVREVRDLVYDAEDVIDEYLTTTAANRYNCSFFFKYFHARHHFGNQIIRIKKEVEEIKARKDRYDFSRMQEGLQASEIGRTGFSSRRGPGAASPFIQEENIVGIEDDVEEIVKMLLEGNQRNRFVISLFGMGGLGKTTLAKEVFKKCKRKFHCYSWVFVSQSCSLRDVLKNMLSGFMESRGEPAILDVMDIMDEGRLHERTYRYLLDKNYLLVLDDIWDGKLWEEVKHSLPGKNGRVVFTTRIKDIESPNEENYYVHHLRPLPYDLAWSIFCHKAFRSSNMTCPEDLREPAEAIVQRCAGLPLAVVAFGGMLSTKEPFSMAWRPIIHLFDWELSQHRQTERLNNALLFSYNNLPFCLKHCFLYIGLFPEDYEIGRKRLIRMWIAEGFIPVVSGQTQEEVANQYLMQLIDRSMILAVTLHARDVLKACKLHGLVRDIAVQMLEEEKFGSIVEGEGEIAEERFRRLSIYDNNADKISSNFGKLNIRSLLMFKSSVLSNYALRKMLRKLKLLRMLDLEGAPLKKLPDDIGESINLRYLGLRGTLIEYLPKSVKNLRNLQALDLRRSKVKHLPAGICKLKQLRHLHLSGFRDRGIGFLKLPKGEKIFLGLQTLSGVEADEDLVREIRKLTNIRKLSVGGMTAANSKEFCNSLEEMTSLRSLTIASESPLEQDIKLGSLSKCPHGLEKLKLQVFMRRLPKWFDSLASLHTLYLFKNFLEMDPFPALEKLANLTILTLASSAFLSKDIKCSSGGFPRLKLLRILDIKYWERWMPIEEGTLTALRYLLIADCPLLEMLPDGFDHLTSLQDLTLTGSCAYLSSRLNEADRPKVSHVQEVCIISEVNGKFTKRKIVGFVGTAENESRISSNDIHENKMLKYEAHSSDPSGVPRGVPNVTEAEQIAAGWPSWLTTVAAGAVTWGWLPQRADNFEKLAKIGEGSFSNVYKGRDLTNGKVVALKKVRFDNLDPESVKFMAREIIILRRLDHPNVIKLEGIVTSRMSSSLYLILEYMEHDLTGIASLPGVVFTEPQIKCYMHQLLSGLEYCHGRGVLQRDIKSSNLLINDEGTLKIADFGLSSFFDSSRNLPLTSRVVTLWYRPPELLLGATDYGVAVDLWSTGCVLAELYSGRPIMPGRTEVEQLHRIYTLCGSPSDDYWGKAKLPHSTLFKPREPYRRRLADEFKDVSLEALELMETLLSIDPENRGTAASALGSKYFATEPYACDPSTLPKYPPTKEIDAGAQRRFHRDPEWHHQMDRKIEEAKKSAKNKRGGKHHPPQSQRQITVYGDSSSVDKVDLLLEEHDRHIQESTQRLRLQRNRNRVKESA